MTYIVTFKESAHWFQRLDIAVLSMTVLRRAIYLHSPR